MTYYIYDIEMNLIGATDSEMTETMIQIHLDNDHIISKIKF